MAASTLPAACAALSWQLHDGRMGVFAEEAFEEGALVERCYSIPLKSVDVPSSDLRQRLYDVGDGCLHLPLGWGLLYADAPKEKANVSWSLDVTEWKEAPMCHLLLRATCAVAPGTELLVSRSSATITEQDVVSWTLSRFQDQGLKLPQAEPGKAAASQRD